MDFGSPKELRFFSNCVLFWVLKAIGGGGGRWWWCCYRLRDRNAMKPKYLLKRQDRYMKISIQKGFNNNLSISCFLADSTYNHQTTIDDEQVSLELLDPGPLVRMRSVNNTGRISYLNSNVSNTPPPPSIPLLLRLNCTPVDQPTFFSSGIFLLFQVFKPICTTKL